MNKHRRAIAINATPSRMMIAGLVGVGLLGMACTTTARGSTSGAVAAASDRARVNPRPSPRYDGSTFSPRIDNAWYPLKPGITYIYRGHEGPDRSRDVVQVTDQVKRVAGVPCRVLKDKVYINGVLEERTSDYYSQDQDGNVWYFGEDTAELDEKGHVVSTEGTWLAGRDGAEAGIFMEAHPQVGHTFQQEYYKGQAEDYYRVLSTRARVRVPYGHFGGNSLRRNVELTKEWTPLEPTIRDHKYYVRGIGQVREITARGRPIESLSLVRIQQR